MTDTSSLPTTHSTPQAYPVTAPSLASPTLNGALSDTNPQGKEDEDYTIKCVCNYSEDDGNTVLCERCDTWQHIECYYPGQKAPDAQDEHFCIECVPKDIDAKRAAERPKRARDQLDGGDRKVKRPAPKSHKKKPKDNGEHTEQLNGWHNNERHTSLMNGADQPPPAKKPKTTHRPSGSIASVNGHVALDSRKRASSNLQSYPSPSKSPQELYRFPSVPTYTTEFLELYDRDEGAPNVTSDAANVYTIPASNKLSAWRENPALLASEKRGNSSSDPAFNYLDGPFNSSAWPEVSVETKISDEDFDGRHPKWKLIRIQQNVVEGNIIGEIRGQVGLMEDYCQTGEMNRWSELRHPDPFVFFHPQMNIYIDSRRDGTKFRYLRRSCRPNVTLKTYISADGEYHNCLVASQDISAGSELTIHWYLDSLTFSENWSKIEPSEENMSKRIAWASKVLANFGDCACDKTLKCYLSSLDHRYSPKSLGISRPVGRKKKTKTRHAISPLSTGQATNSRAGSEAVRIQDDDDQYDRRSTSASSRSHPESRDMTPTQVGSLDEQPLLGSDLTVRERKKIAALEESFKRANQTQRKKKRPSGGSTLSTPTVNSSKQHAFGPNSNPTTPSVPGAPSALQTDVKIPRPFSGSPPPRPTVARPGSQESPYRPSSSREAHFSSSARSQPNRPSYVDVKTQTEPEEPEVLEMPPSKRRKFITPTQRLLKKVLEDRARYEQQSKNTDSLSPTVSSSPADSAGFARQAQRRASIDVEMKDAAVSVMWTPERSSIDLKSPLASPTALRGTPPSFLPQFPLPSQAAHSQKPVTHPGGLRLHLSTLPPVPSFAGISTPVTSAPGAQHTTTPSTVQSPLTFSSGSSSYPGLITSNLPAPSPARKKLSLGDYMSRKNNVSTPAMEKTQAQAESSSMEETKANETSESITLQALAASRIATAKPPSEHIKQEATIKAEIPTKCDSDYSPPEVLPFDGQLPSSNAVTSASAVPFPPAVQTPSTGAIAPELAAVLAELQAFSSTR